MPSQKRCLRLETKQNLHELWHRHTCHAGADEIVSKRATTRNSDWEALVQWKHGTVEPRYNDPRYNNILCSMSRKSYSKMYGSVPRYNNTSI